jgi:Divergent InlB B-repeat domain
MNRYLPALLGALLALALAFPAVSAAAEFSFAVNTTNGTGEGEVECTIHEPGEEIWEEEICDGTYPANTKITVEKPEPEEGSEFVGFRNGTNSAAGCSNHQTCGPITLTANSAVDAIFDLKQFTLKIEKKGSGGGVVKCEVDGPPETCAAKYPYETELILIAEANSTSDFIGWVGCEPEEEEECELTIEEATTVKATFNLQPLLKIAKTGSGSGVVECEAEGSLAEPCEGHYPRGTELVLVAEPGVESEFAGWSGDCSGKEEECELEMTVTHSVTATFDSTAEDTPEATGPGKVAAPEDEEEEEEDFFASTGGRAKAAGVAKVKGGKAALKLSCRGGPCNGRLKLTAKLKQGGKLKTLTIGQASFKLAKGTSKTLAVKLSGPAKQELRRAGTLKAKLNGSGIAASTLKLKPAV